MKYRTLPLLCLVFAMSFSQCLMALDLYNYCSINNEQSDEAFLNDFPYLEYLEKFSLQKLDILEQHRQYLAENGRDGDHFLFKLCETYLSANPVDIDNPGDLKAKIQMGETFLRLDGVLSGVYPAMGDYLLSTVTDAVQHGIKEKQLNPKKFDVKYILTRLEDNLYAVDVPMSNKDKFILHAKQGNWSYIWSRVRSRYLEEFIFLLSIGIFVGIFGVRFLIRYAAKKQEFNRKLKYD